MASAIGLPRWVVPALTACWGLLQTCDLPAQEPAETVPAFFQTHCVRCHSAELSEGDFRIDQPPTDAEADEFGHLWARAYERVNSGEMPPADEPQPSADERYQAAEWIARGLQAWDAARNARMERVSFKRLSRTEYVNTLEDLLGFTYHPTDPGGLPEDPNWHGLERMGGVLSLTPSHIERYVSAAEFALQNTLPTGGRPEPWKFEWTAAEVIRWDAYRERLARDPATPRHRLLIGPANNWKHYVGGLHRVSVPRAGLYRIRVAGSGLRPEGGSPPHVVLYDATIDRTLLEQDLESPEEQPIALEAEVWLPGGTHDLVLRNELPGPSPYDSHQRGGNVDIFTSLDRGRSPFLQKLSDDRQRPYAPLLILDSVTIEAVVDPWPSAAQVAIIGEGDRDAAHIERIVARFAERAFRRPPTPEEVRRYTAVATTATETGLGFDDAIRESLVAVLCSHDFLFLVEGSAAEPRSTLNDFELASRLSYFLWSTMPDEQLFKLAAAGDLSRGEVLLAEFDRMVADPRAAERFAKDFSRQWLRLADVGKFPPDKKLYPGYDPGLQRSMIAEPQEYFARMLRENRSVRELIDSDWTMLNNRLAEHYGVEGVAGFELRPVPLEPGHHRGGLLTQAATLSLTSDGFRHRPVHRGKWISEVMFGITPPPPPPNAGTLPAAAEGEQKTTLRGRLEAHRADPACAACHAKIDPLGFALDNYDAIGRWQTADGSQTGPGESPPVDASGVLPDGRRFAGVEDFKRLMLEDVDKIAFAVTEKLACYSLRRGMTFSDRRAIEEIVAEAKTDGYRLQDLLRRLVASDLFRSR